MEFHGDVAGIMQLAELAKNVGIVDFARAGMMAAGYIRDVDQIDEIQVLFKFGDEVARGDLFVKEIIKKFDVRIADGADDFKAFGGVGQKIFGVFFRVDVFNKQ